MSKIMSVTKGSRAASVSSDRDRGTMPVLIDKFDGSVLCSQQDLLAVEEPLQIRLNYQINGIRTEKDVAITMRTPGNDVDLAAGFLFSEGILEEPDQIVQPRDAGEASKSRDDCNRVVIELKSGADFDAKRLERHFYISSSCGVCGKTSIESLRSRLRFTLSSASPRVESAVIRRLPETLRKVQAVFDKTGGLHAAALFDFFGNLLSVREDVGRHNGVDKLIGAAFLRGSLPLRETIVLLSGRASFELIQKALMAGIPVVAAVGAPSSLAVEMAQNFGLTLIGFLRGDQFNVYSGASRLRKLPDQVSSAGGGY